MCYPLGYELCDLLDMPNEIQTEFHPNISCSSHLLHMRKKPRYISLPHVPCPSVLHECLPLMLTLNLSFAVKLRLGETKIQKIRIDDSGFN